MSALNKWSSMAAGLEPQGASAASQLLEFFFVVVIVEAEVHVEARLLPQTTRHQLLLHKQFLEEVVAEAEWAVAVDEVQEAEAGPR